MMSKRTFVEDLSVGSKATEREIMPKAKIVAADDNPDVLKQIAEIAQSEFEVAATFRNAQALLDVWSWLKPDVIVLDISMQEMSGIDLALELIDDGCMAKIVFLTTHNDPDFLRAAMVAGGSAYIVKTQMRSDLVPALKAVLSQQKFVSPSLQYDKHQRRRTVITSRQTDTFGQK